MKKILSKLSLVAAIAAMGMIYACGTTGNNSNSSPEESIPESSAVCEHSGGSATCTEAAVCEKCGESYGKALGHTYVEGKCSCGAVDPDYVAPHQHVYDSVVTAPTCTTDGYTTYTCECGHSYTADEVPATDHDYTSVVTAPTCTTDGYTTYTCECGHSYTDDTVPASHDYDDKGICSVCGDITSVIPVVGKGYAFGMYQGKLGKVYYLKGGMSGYYMATTTNIDEALLVFIEETTGGYYAYCYVNGVKTYINMVTSGTHVNGAYQAAASTVYTIDEEHKTLIGKVNNKDYWFATRNDNTYTTMGPCLVSYNGFYGEFYYKHDHSFTEGKVVAPTCTADGYTEQTCSCGAVEKTNVVKASGHNYNSVVTAPTCTVAGYTTYTCDCGDTYTADEVPATDHTFVDGTCSCGAQDPNYEAHVHVYNEVVTAPTCSTTGYTTYTCACGDTYTGAETEMLPHVDTNLDITCDYDGCNKRILPDADSKVSLFTANHMIIVSLSSNYYVEGVVTEITDAKNGMFIIQDEAGDTIFIRMPKDADGNLYSTWTNVKVVLGDTIQVYGKPTQNMSAPTSQKAKIEGGLLTILKHEHAFSEATCTEASTCACLTVNAPALGHLNENGDNLCDRCEWNLNLQTSNIAITTDTTLSNGVQTMGTDGKAAAWTWSDNNFNVIIAKGASTVTLYTNAKAYMQLKKLNTFTLENKNGKTIKTVTLSTTNATQLTNLKNALVNNGLTFTVNETDLTLTIEWNSTENLTFTNNGTQTAYISGAEIVYE